MSKVETLILDARPIRRGDNYLFLRRDLCPLGWAIAEEVQDQVKQHPNWCGDCAHAGGGCGGGCGGLLWNTDWEAVREAAFNKAVRGRGLMLYCVIPSREIGGDTAFFLHPGDPMPEDGEWTGAIVRLIPEAPKVPTPPAPETGTIARTLLLKHHGDKASPQAWNLAVLVDMADTNGLDTLLALASWIPDPSWLDWPGGRGTRGVWALLFRRIAVREVAEGRSMASGAPVPLAPIPQAG